jgi:hypothetical protein
LRRRLKKLSSSQLEKIAQNRKIAFARKTGLCVSYKYPDRKIRSWRTKRTSIRCNEVVLTAQKRQSASEIKKLVRDVNE